MSEKEMTATRGAAVTIGASSGISHDFTYEVLEAGPIAATGRYAPSGNETSLVSPEIELEFDFTINYPGIK